MTTNRFRNASRTARENDVSDAIGVNNNIGETTEIVISSHVICVESSFDVHNATFTIEFVARPFIDDDKATLSFLHENEQTLRRIMRR